METASQCIGTHEPAFVAGIAFGVVLAILLAGMLVRFESTLRGKSLAFVRRSLAWGLAEGVAFVGPSALTMGLYAWQHPERELCTSVVWRWYLVPPAVLVVTGIAGGVWTAALQRRRSLKAR